MRITNVPGRDERAAALGEFVASKGRLSAHEAILCALYWLERDEAPPVKAQDVAVVYPRHDGRRVQSVADAMRHHVERRLAEPLGDGRYRLTPLGALVVEALPDRAEVARLRGLRMKARGPRPL